LRKDAGLARMVETAQAALPPNPHSGDFLHCQTLDQSASNNVQLITVALIET